MSALLILEALSKLLPNDTALDRLRLTYTQLQLQGESANAAELIGLFERESWIEEANFRTQITQNRNTGLERFVVSATIVDTPDVISPQRYESNEPQN